MEQTTKGPAPAATGPGPQQKTSSAFCMHAYGEAHRKLYASLPADSNSEFIEAIRAAGMEPPEHIEPGRFYRFAGAGKGRGNSAGWCRLFPDGTGGVFGDWSTGLSEAWQAMRDRQISKAEREAFQRQAREAKAQADAERKAAQRRAAERAQAIWQAAEPAPADHAYLQRKGVQAHGLKLHGGALAVPLRDATGALQSLQFIDADGGKRFLTDGRTRGTYCAIGRPSAKLLVAEGYATGATLHEITGHAVAVAFNAGNLAPVAQALRDKLPDVQLVVCADDDVSTPGNPGISKGRQAAEAVGAALAVPDFGADRPDGCSDFNDLARHAGADAVRRCVDAAQRPAVAAQRVKLPEQPQWPTINEKAYHGLVGDVVRTIGPHTEADPVALLVQFLAAFGNCVGRGPHYLVEGDKHYPNLFAVMVGQSSKARKGTSWGRIRRLFEMVDSEQGWLQAVQSGLSSGEGLIWAVRDPVMGREKTGKGADVHYVEVEQDPGVSDKRLMVVESEFANVLRVLTREGNTLSRVIRDGWDRGDLATMTKNSPARATGAHLSIVGHVTDEELRRYLDRTEAANGFANRFLYACVRRSKALPHGGNLTDADLQPLAQQLTTAIADARRMDRITMTPEAARVWEVVYPDLSEGQPGLLGAITARAEAQVIRLSLLYALSDGAPQIEPAHLYAALALWEYAAASAGYIFGATLGDPVADEIMRALEQAGSAGMSRTDISRLFNRNRSATQLGRALDLLAQHRRAYSDVQHGEGRPVEFWFAGEVDYGQAA